MRKCTAPSPFCECLKCFDAKHGAVAVVSSAGFAVGDWVRILPHGQWDYEVAEIKMYPHGLMIGIYDEPPSKHVDYWNASSLKLSRLAKH